MHAVNAHVGPLRIVIVSPALADANNGNWQTAQRWQSLLTPHDVRIVKTWPDPAARRAGAQPDVVMLALHARRSADSVAAWAARPEGGRGLAVVLTGTDLYRDIQTDAVAQRSLALAAQLVVLQERGPEAMPAELRSKTRVIFQSTPALAPVHKPPAGTQLRALMVGHLRQEKSPETLFEAGPGLRISMLAVPLAGRPAARSHAPAHTTRACVGARQPNRRWRPCGDGGGVQWHAGAGLAHSRQYRHAGRRLCRLL
jgi:hypothetical protein